MLLRWRMSHSKLKENRTPAGFQRRIRSIKGWTVDAVGSSTGMGSTHVRQQEVREISVWCGTSVGRGNHSYKQGLPSCPAKF